MDIGKAFSYVFDDEDWLKKILIGGLLNIIPLVGSLFTYGYMIETTKRVIDGYPTPLPAWDDWGGKFMKGLIYFVITLVYFLPLLLVMICFGVAIGIAGSQMADPDDIATVVGIANACIGCLALVYSLLVMLILPAAVAKYADTGQIGAAFQFGEIIGLVRANIGTYLMVLLLTLVAGLIGSLGTIACGVGLLFTMFYANLIMGSLFGAAYRQSTAPASARWREGCWLRDTR